MVHTYIPVVSAISFIVLYTLSLFTVYLLSYRLTFCLFISGFLLKTDFRPYFLILEILYPETYIAYYSKMFIAFLSNLNYYPENFTFPPFITCALHSSVFLCSLCPFLSELMLFKIIVTEIELIHI